ncbi:rRNA (guanine-N2)-methyltransferase [Spirochaetia bacterium]|nr:rRNA (guanine-N2)-methyltransferase [Spirochaetia bacterium]
MTQDPNKDAAQAEMLENRLRKRYKHLKKWAKRVGTDVFRLYDRDIPEIPLVLDCFGDAISGALYKRPYEKDENDERRWFAAMRDAAARALDIEARHVFIKFREPQRLNAQYQRLQSRVENVHYERDVHEGGLCFRVNLSDYLDTGFFPDRRKMRALVREEAAGKEVLNLFCYTASFSVYAAAGGAARVDSVDLSRTYLDWAALNFRLNGYEASLTGPNAPSPRTAVSPQYALIRADVLSFLAAAEREKKSWDMIILDPPTFSNSKKMESTLDIKRDHQALISQALKLLKSGGRLWFSANARRFHLDAGDFPGYAIKDMEEAITDEDFAGKRIPECYLFQV